MKFKGARSNLCCQKSGEWGEEVTGISHKESYCVAGHVLFFGLSYDYKDYIRLVEVH